MRNTSARKQPARKLSTRKLPTRKLLGAIIATALFVPGIGFTLGLGEIEVNSALNQKLSADIELLSTTPEDTENIIVKLASRDAFTRAGLDRPYALNDLRFKAEIINDVPYIRVSSGGVIREPFLNFLVEVDWPNGHLLREYTVLLDPPVFMTQAASAPVLQATSDSRPSASGTIYSAPAVSNTVVSQPVYQTPAPVVQQPVVKQPRVQAAPPVVRSQSVQRQTVQPRPVQRSVVQRPAAPSGYKIKKGDTAWSLANSMRPDQSVTVEQMMIAMLRNNPDSFIDGNINGLRRGYVLRVPDYEQIVSVSKNKARTLVRKQAALWRQYQQAKSGAQLASAMEKKSAGSADFQTANTPTAKQNDAYLEIVSAGIGASTTSVKDPTRMTAKELRAELALARERIETERVEKEGLLKKVSQLQKSAGDTGLISIVDDQLSDVQALNLPDAKPVASKLDDTLTELKAAAESAVDEIVVDETTKVAAVAAAEEVAAKASEMADATADDALFVDEKDETTAAVDATMPAAQTNTQDSVDPQAAQDSASESQSWAEKIQSWVEKLKNNPTLAAAAGGGLLLLLGLFGWMFKRGKSDAETAVTSGFDGLEALAGDVAEDQEAELIITEDGGEGSNTESSAQEVDSDATTETDLSDVADEIESDDTEEEEEPRDDVIAEADVYLAYGIYQQAEELLKQAIADNPDRHDYRLKLAETYYASKDAAAFTDVATEIKEKAGEESPLWKKTLVMGQDLCSDNPMFQGTLIGGIDIDSITPQAPEMDLDLGLDATNDADRGDSEIDEVELPEMEGLADVGEELESGILDDGEAVDELEFDLSDAGAAEEVEVVDDDFSLDIDASELDITDVAEISTSTADTDIDFGLDEVGTDATADVVAEATVEDAVADVADNVAELDTDKLNINEQEEEISLDLTDATDSFNLDTETDVDDEVNLDLTDATDSFNLDIDDDAIEIVSDSEADDEEFDLSSLDDVDEISTKLDLARAYLDMGDKEGTRSILEEVVAEGNDDQKHEANSLMAKLG